MGHTNSQGGWSGNLPLLAESASYPKKLGEALLTSWVQGCVAINAAWSNQAVALTWQGPCESVEFLPTPEPKKVSKTSGLGPWDVIADTAVGSTAVGPDFGPWSSRHSHVQPSSLAAASPSNSSCGPWGGTACAGLSSSLGPWGSIVAVPDTPTFGPWGIASCAISESEEEGDAEASPGQIGSPK